MNTIEERLDILEEKMRAESFRTNKGLGNEVGYYVFDYEPNQELIVRKGIQDLQNTNTELKFGYGSKKYTFENGTLIAQEVVQEEVIK